MKARAQVHLSVQAYQRVFTHYAGWDWPAVRRAAAAFEAPIAAFRPAYLDEMRGLAEGAGLDVADVLAINVRTEVMYAAKARQAPLAHRTPAECSAFALVRASRAPGEAASALLGQNWDWLLHSARTLVVLEARQDDGPDFVTVVEAGLLAKAGLNAAGLGLVTNALVTDADIGAPGLPYHVLLRAILDCATVTEALSVLQARMRSSSANYLIAHASGAALDVEAAPGDFTRLYPRFPDQGLLLHTNHFLSPRLHPVDVSLWAMPSSAVRLQRLQAAETAVAAAGGATVAAAGGATVAAAGGATVAAAGGATVAAAGGAPASATLDGFRALLADHADYPHSICAHPDPDEHPLEQGATIASVLMDLNARRVWLAAGNPCQVPYTELDLSWLTAPAPAGAAR